MEKKDVFNFAPDLAAIGNKLRHKPTGQIVEVVHHNEPLRMGYGLGLGRGVYKRGVSIKQGNGNYSFVLFSNLEKFFEVV